MKMYRLKNMAFVGVVALVAVAFWMLASLCIPTFRYSATDRQLYTIRHQELRDNNTLYTDLFLQSIKANNGYLVLGTSESDYMYGENYYDFLNADTTLKCRFSLIAGAGRTACTYFPLIQSNKNIGGLKIIYFINPAYWCNKLARSNADYFFRYTSFANYCKANNPENKAVSEILKVNLRSTRLDDVMSDFFSYYIDRVRCKYYQDLAFSIDTAKFESTLSWIKPQREFLRSFPNEPPDSSTYNYDLNVDAAFDIYSYSLDAHPEATYRYDELCAMIQVCRENNVDITFVVGPYNRVAFGKAHPTEVPEMQSICDSITNLLEAENANYIDATDISSTAGAFRDWQHHSSYGAYLIYQKIKDYVVEKENR